MLCNIVRGCRPFVVVPLTLLLGGWTIAQQVGDESFTFKSSSPAFEKGMGPTVCIDEAHNNFHTADGRYRSFAELLRLDGFIVEGSAQPFSASSLSGCRLLVIANAIANANNGNWAFPHPTAFQRQEIEALYRWLEQGGALMLIVDHAPMPGSASALMEILGASGLDGYANNDPSQFPDVFERDNGGLKVHPISEGRSDQERVNKVATFTGHAFVASADFEPLLVFGPRASVRINLSSNFTDIAGNAGPQIPVEGWLHAAARQLGKGRVVLLGEAAMCSAQLAGPNRRPMGMNHPDAADNPQFCLNAARWLTGVLE